MFLGFYIAAVVLMIVYFIMLMKLCRDQPFSRGYVILYTLATLCPFLNVGVATICGILMVGLLYERMEIQKWLDKPLIKARKE